MNSVAGVKFETLEEPIRKAMMVYQEISNDRLRFAIDAAAVLKRTPDKSTWARSETPVTYGTGKERVTLGPLAVIAFAPRKPGRHLDGTGNETAHKLADVKVAKGLPRSPKIVPRSKTSHPDPHQRLRSEGHLTLVTHKIDREDAEPEIFGGSLDLIGIENGIIKKTGVLGHANTAAGADIVPVTTLTFGYKHGKDRKLHTFGDPHAVFNSSQVTLQVCGFLAVTEAQFAAHGDILGNCLEAREPLPVQIK